MPTSADQSQNPAPWLAGDESLEKQWQCKTPSQGILSRFLGTQTFSLKIYLTSHRLITEVTGNKKIEISDFPIDCVRGLTWNIGPSKGSLKVSTFGIPGLQMPTSSLLKHGYWGRELIEFDSRAPDVKNMVETLNTRFNRPLPPILQQ